MSDDLDGVVRGALHDSRLEPAIEFHVAPDGTKSGAIQMRDERGTTVARAVVGARRS